MEYKELSNKINTAIYMQDEFSIEMLHDLLYAVKNIDDYTTRDIKRRMTNLENAVKDL